MTMNILLDGNNQERDQYNNPTSKSVPYLITNAKSENEALQLVQNNAPNLLDGLSFTGTSLNKSNNDGSFEVTAKYVKKNLNDSNQQIFLTKVKPRINWQTTAITETCKKTRQRVYATEEAPDHIKSGTAINQQPDGTVQGVPIATGCQSFSEVHYFNERQLTTKFRKTLASISHHVNENSWRGYAAGEVKFDSASFSYIEDQEEKVAVTFNFSVSGNVPISSLTDSANVGSYLYQNFSNGPIADGWDYKWFYPEEIEGETEDDDVEVIQHLVIDRVYPRVNFKLLGIGD
ncbi:hypothetical protein AAEX28_02460 [Lentisphaerota bacterium WC36G]|nr:hypothetical protein LJT99_05345 [Lentisphaerae bacterium WC36]